MAPLARVGWGPQIMIWGRGSVEQSSIGISPWALLAGESRAPVTAIRWWCHWRMTNLGSLTNGGDGIVTADSVPTLPPGIVVSNFGINIYNLWRRLKELSHFKNLLLLKYFYKRLSRLSNWHLDTYCLQNLLLMSGLGQQRSRNIACQWTSYILGR